MNSTASSLWRHWLGLALLAGIAWIHFRDIPDKLGETPYLGWLYILLVVGCGAAGAWLMSSLWRAGYWLGSLISAGAILFFVLTRSVGLPNAKGDIGNWAEPAGIISLLLEAGFVVLALTSSRERRVVPQQNQI
ncbi:hypothetical protein FNU79_03045 [Deinococcus detaillensis]|uniref:DUF4345 domain-containing protein n=1 Tax=Deinococcus detaillensis TaxID=2592048 RepID=A0A553V4Q8_9DEIO|nr:hypothetical protein [Deinococcus detaillensis]TSA87473.1 hypothetical protein FNU79_03045 [Deinococcus detaillensis]